MVNNLVFRWPNPLFFMVLGAHGSHKPPNTQCMVYLGCGPLPSNSHHQDYEPFFVGNPYKPSFATGILGRGPHPRYIDP